MSSSEEDDDYDVNDYTDDDDDDDKEEENENYHANDYTDDDEAEDEDDYQEDGGNDKTANDADPGNFADESENTNEFQSINVYPPGQTDEEQGLDRTTNNYDGSEEETGKRRMVIIGLAVCCCIWLIASVAFGVLAFTKKDDKPKQTAIVAQPITPTNAPVPTSPPVVATETPSLNPSAVPSSFLQSEFVYPAKSSTYIQRGITDPQSNSPTLLVENGNGNSDAYALFELDVTSKLDNIFRRQLIGQFTGKKTRSFLRLFLAADPGSPPPKLTLFRLPQVDLKFLTAQEFNPVLEEQLESFRISDLPHPAITGIANINKNVFLPPPRKGDPIWIDITEQVDNAAAFGEESIILMLQNRDAVQAPGTGTRFYGVNSDDPPALVVFLDDTVPTVSPVPSMSMAPSSNPSGSIYPTNINSAEPSLSPSMSGQPTNKPSRMTSSNPTSAPSTSARPSVSERPSRVPSISSAPSTSAQPSKIASGTPSKSPVESEFPTNSGCLPCPLGQVLQWSSTSVASLSETCGNLRIRLLYSEYALFDATPTECDDIVNTCGCEDPVACTACDAADEVFKSSDTISIDGVSCQEAQVTLLTQEFAYSEDMCTALKVGCACEVPTNLCTICPTDQSVSDPDFVLSTTTMGLTSCGELEIKGAIGFINTADCNKLQAATSLCQCEERSEEPSSSPTSISSMVPSIQASSVPSKQPSMSNAPSASIAPSKQPSLSHSPSTSAAPSTTSAAPSKMSQ